jgi:acyl-CoA reductase-like NAD-dependent aldehyde dehydrogenase
VIETVNPADGTPLARYPAMSSAEVEAALRAGAAAARQWGREPVETRVAAVARLAAHLRDDRERYAALITSEMGKPITEARAEVEKSAVTADYYAAHAAELLATSPSAWCWR